MWFTSSYVLLRAFLEGSSDIGDRTEREEMLRRSLCIFCILIHKCICCLPV